MANNKTVNGVPIESIIKQSEFDPTVAERIPGRSNRVHALAVVEPNPLWPEHFATLAARISAQFPVSDEQSGIDHDGPLTIIAVNHVGSTSVPGLPAKNLIDIDLVLSRNDLAAEPLYVPRLEAAGFEFRLREPPWHGHRFFSCWEPIPCNLHVWGPNCPEVERHRIFRDWLRTHADDRDQYAMVKRESAALANEKGEGMQDYNYRKEWVVREILLKAFRSLGYC